MHKYPAIIFGWLITLFLFLCTGCDLISPQKSYRIAVPEQDYSYQYSAKHLEALLEKNGYTITIVPTKNAIEANKMVAEGDADLTFIMDHSDFIPTAIGSRAGKLRTITPLFQRLFFLFSKSETDTIATIETLENKSIGIEVLGGETNTDLRKLLSSMRLDNIEIINRDDNPDFIHFWGTFYGERATTLLNQGWREVSIDPDWVNFISLNDPSLDPFILPALPGVDGSVNLNTISVQTLLVGGAHLGENAVYELSEYIFSHKLDLVGFDIMYRYISESFNLNQLLYPIHTGTDKYLRRNQPTFFERYAELIALIFSFVAILYGAIQGIRTRLVRIKKERIDLYFLRYSEIRSQENLSDTQKIELLSELLQKALIQLTNEKLDKTDFHIFSRLVQQELSFLKQHV